MKSGRVFDSGTEFKKSLAGDNPRCDAVLLVEPTGFDLVYEINPHMDLSAGSVDRAVAFAASRALAATYESLDIRVHWLPGDARWPDLVFCANQTFPYCDEAGKRRVFLSEMAHKERQGEVPLLSAWFEREGFAIDRFEGPGPIEGQGDLLWVPEARALFGGIGPRTRIERLEELARRSGLDILALQLVDERFYHLDTCLSPLGRGRALYVPEAFDQRSREALSQVFPHLIAVDQQEAVVALAANAHAPDDANVIIEASARRTIARLAGLGFRVHPLDTSPYLRAGGSVFCLKQMIPAASSR